jgi:hypothetical protein
MQPFCCRRIHLVFQGKRTLFPWAVQDFEQVFLIQAALSRFVWILGLLPSFFNNETVIRRSRATFSGPWPVRNRLSSSRDLLQNRRQGQDPAQDFRDGLFFVEDRNEDG